MSSEIIKDLRDFLSEENILINEELGRHTTFRTGGPASLFISPDNEDELKRAVSIIRDFGIPFFIIGNGSNLLVSDAGFDGVVISLSHFAGLELSGASELNIGAGANNVSVAAFARDNELTGFEFAAGIPGTVGGAVIMNAGAYDGEFKDIVKEVTVLSPDGEVMTLDNESMEFGYRTSAIKGRGYIVLSVRITLARGDKDSISNKMKELATRRKEKQPLEYPSAGSTFKRPENNFAGRLIEEAGLRGFELGGAAVSEKHCGFVINKNNATSADIYKLIKEVQKRVYNSSGVMLEPEVIMVGDFKED